MNETQEKERVISPDVILRRFFREAHASGTMAELKRRRYFEREPSRNIRRKRAVARNVRRKAHRGY